MKYELFHGLKIPKIGFGCWRIGGESKSDPAVEKQSVTALQSAVQLGYRHFDTAEYYAGGHSEELLGTTIRESGVPREEFFITSKVSPEHLSYHTLLESCARSLQRLGFAYLDLYLIHWPMVGMDLNGAFRALNLLVKQGFVRSIGVSNFDLNLLKQAAAFSESPLLTNQVPYSIPDRTYDSNGVVDYCQKNGILITAYSPVKNRFFSGSELVNMSLRTGFTPHQLGLAWLVAQPSVITIPKSMNAKHQAENLAAGDIELSSSDLEILTSMA